MRIKRAVYLSEQGSQRKTNQDGLLCLNRVPLFAVADGSGGLSAARTALMVLKDQSVHLSARNAAVASNPNTTTRLALGRFFESAFDQANAALHDASEGRTTGLASTMVAATVVGSYAFIAHVGDSRAYLLRNRRLRCLTNDHTLAALQLRRGDISADEYLTSPFRSALSQALGVSTTLEVDVAEIHLMPSDVLLLCTNGVHRFVSEDVMHKALSAARDDLEGASKRLMKTVIDAGAPDNASVVLIATEPEAESNVPVEDLEAAVREVFLFKQLSEPAWLRVWPYLEEIRCKTGEVVVRAGDPADAMHFVAAGSVVVEQSTLEHREIGPRGHFGALTLASGARQLDDVTALEPTILYVLTRERFQQLVAQHPALGTGLALTLLEALGGRLGVLTSRLALIIEAVHGQLPANA